MGNSALFFASLQSLVAPGFTGAYDGFADLKIAYGLRRMLTSYTGSLVRIARIDTGTQTDIGYTTAGDLDVSAVTAFTGSIGNTHVVTFYDQTGSGQHAIATAMNGKLQAEGSRYSVLCDPSTNTSYKSGFYIPNSAATNASGTCSVQTIYRQVISPATLVGDTRGGAIFAKNLTVGDTFNNHHPYSDGTSYVSFYMTDRLTYLEGATSRTDLRVHGYSTSTNRLDYYRNGVSGGNVTGVTNTTITAAFFPDCSFGTTVCGELAWFSRTINDTNMLAVANVQKSYYGIA